MGGMGFAAGFQVALGHRTSPHAAPSWRSFSLHSIWGLPHTHSDGASDIREARRQGSPAASTANPKEVVPPEAMAGPTDARDAAAERLRAGLGRVRALEPGAGGRARWAGAH